MIESGGGTYGIVWSPQQIAEIEGRSLGTYFMDVVFTGMPPSPLPSSY